MSKIVHTTTDVVHRPLIIDKSKGLGGGAERTSPCAMQVVEVARKIFLGFYIVFHIKASC